MLPLPLPPSPLLSTSSLLLPPLSLLSHHHCWLSQRYIPNNLIHSKQLIVATVATHCCPYCNCHRCCCCHHHHCRCCHHRDCRWPLLPPPSLSLLPLSLFCCLHLCCCCHHHCCRSVTTVAAALLPLLPLSLLPQSPLLSLSSRHHGWAVSRETHAKQLGVVAAATITAAVATIAAVTTDATVTTVATALLPL